jgi:hypothetical protein
MAISAALWFRKMQVRRPRTAAVMLAAVLLSTLPADARHRLECPPQAPSEWGLSNPAPLDQVGVLSQPIDQSIDDTSPPTLVPDRGYARGSVWHNTWLMGDEAGWSHFIDCRYRGSSRVLWIKADGLEQCEQTAQPYSAKAGIADRAMQTMACD